MGQPVVHEPPTQQPVGEMQRNKKVSAGAGALAAVTLSVVVAGVVWYLISGETTKAELAIRYPDNPTENQYHLNSTFQVHVGIHNLEDKTNCKIQIGDNNPAIHLDMFFEPVIVDLEDRDKVTIDEKNGMAIYT